jgi:hypothetical protein
MPAITYTVQGGDTLSAIAKRFGKTVKDLAAINKIRDVNNISAGRTLIIDDEAEPAHVRWRKVGESQTSPYTNKERKEVLIDPCECIKKFFEAAKAIAAKPIQSDPFGDKKAKAMRTVRGVRRFHADFKAYEFAKAAEAVYGTSAPGKWRVATDEDVQDYGLKRRADLKPDSKDNKIPSNFKAEIYVPMNLRFCEPMPAVLVFKGTDPNIEDVLNNLEQGTDFDSDYYRQAVQLGRKLMKAQKPIVIVGHSLGGGLASACAHTCGKDSWTFNAAGLHPNTIERYGETPIPTKIEAYRHEGEILTAVQEPGWAAQFARVVVPPMLGWLGGPLGLFVGAWVTKKLHEAPVAVGTKHDIVCADETLSAADRHRMTKTLVSFNQQLRNAEAELRQQTGVQCNQRVVV